MIEFWIVKFASFYGAGGEAGLAIIVLMVMMVVAILGNGSFRIICVGRVVTTVIVGGADGGCIGGFWLMNATTGTI